jgi:hypothetical protein
MNIVAYAILLLNSCIVQFISIIHFKSFVIIVTQLADRISIIVKGFFHDRQKAFTELPA